MPITKNGYIYIYTANENVVDVNVHFDDVAVTLIEGPVTSASDYYPFGLVMDGQSWTSEPYRFGYQGQFSEYDEETGWNAFEARMYDPVVGRWITIDPAGQFASPYVGMGNAPINLIDPNGEWVKGAGLWNNLFKSDSRIYAERYAESWSSNIVDYYASKAGDAWGIYAVDKSWRYKERYSSFTPVNGDGSLGGTEGWFESWEPSPGNIDFDPLTQLSLGFIVKDGISVINAGIVLGGRTAIYAAGRYATIQSAKNFRSFMTANELRAFTYSQSTGVRAMMRGKGVDAALRYYAGRNIILNSATRLKLIEIGSRTFGPDMVGRGLLRGFWWDVTTVGSWSSHALKYTPRYGVGKGLFY